MDWDEYAELPRRNFWPSDQVMRFEARVPEGGVVLDIGCGTGNNLWYMEWENRHESVGIDISWKGLQGAREWLGSKQGGCELIPLCQASAETLPFKANAFDGVLDIKVSQHFPWAMRTRAYQEVARVLKPGGRFRLVCWGHGDAAARYGGLFPELEAVVPRRVLYELLSRVGLEPDKAHCSRFSDEVWGDGWPEWALWNVVEAVKV